MLYHINMMVSEKSLIYGQIRPNLDDSVHLGIASILYIYMSYCSWQKISVAIMLFFLGGVGGLVVSELGYLEGISDKGRAEDLQTSPFHPSVELHAKEGRSITTAC